MLEAATDLIGSFVASRYRLTRRIGQGGMGEVYEATDGAQRFALKLIRRDRVDPESFARFMREAMLTKSIDDRHLVSTLDFGIDRELGAPFILMPLLDGTDLGAVLARTGALAPEVACRIGRHACAGLSALHAVGIVHRDIKPSNLFLERHGGEVLVRVMDFGIAKPTDATSAKTLTETGKALGSPHYMSPEQIKSSKHVDARSDLFSLGLVLYEMLSGRLPWQDTSSLADLMLEICMRDVPALEKYAGWVEPALAACVMRALDRDPARRYPSAAELAEALARFTLGEDRVVAEMLVPVPEKLRFSTLPHSSSTTRNEAPTQRTLDDGEVADPLLWRLLGGRYRLLRLIGRGGMGAVYEAQSPDGKRVATKLISSAVAGSDDHALRRFLREAQAARAIQNPHVVQTFELAIDQELGVPYLVMELLAGADLCQLIEERAPLEVAPTLRLFIQAARGLAAAHARGIVHRDIKPANLYLHAPDPAGPITVKVCDFGVAKRTALGAEQSQDLTRTGGMLGSPVYMSPEQAKNAKNVDHRSDIWSLSVTLYEALSGRRPWQEYSSLGEIIVAICTETLPPLEAVAPWIDPALAAIVQRGLERLPDARWQSADDLIEALKPFSGGTEAVGFSLLARVDESCLTAPARVVIQSDSVDSTALGSQATIAASVEPVTTTATRARRGKGVWTLALGGVAALGLVGTGVVLIWPGATLTDEAVGAAAPALASGFSPLLAATPTRLPVASASATPLTLPNASAAATPPSASTARASKGAPAPAAKPKASKPTREKVAKDQAKSEQSPSRTAPGGVVAPKDEWQ